MLHHDFSWILYIARGTFVTVAYCVLPLLIGTLLGTTIAMTSFGFERVRTIRYLIKAYVSVIRGTPLLLQLSFCYFVVPSIFKIHLSPFGAAVLALSINSSAYVSEVIKAGINAVDQGQLLAAKTLGLSKRNAIIDIILPQAIRNILPALVNECLNLVKESAIVGIIGVDDIMRRTQLISAEHYTYFGPLCIAGLCYYCTVLCLSTTASFLDKKLHDKYR